MEPPIIEPPPGWYRDPQSPERLRYWDGGMWTQATAKKSERSYGDPLITKPTPPGPGSPDPSGSGWGPIQVLGCIGFIVGATIFLVTLFYR